MIIEDNFYYLSLKPYVVSCDPSSEPFRSDGSEEGHNICFYAELTKIIHYYRQILPLI